MDRALISSAAANNGSGLGIAETSKKQVAYYRADFSITSERGSEPPQKKPTRLLRFV